MKRIEGKIRKTSQRLSRVFPAPITPPNGPVVVALTNIPEVITGDPSLPPELERAIFELVAANDPVDSWTHQHVGDTVLVLPQVCRRVQSWIEPIIYERISLLYSYNGGEPVPKFLATIDARPASFFAAHVKYLYFDHYVPLPAVRRVLSVCTGAASVGCHHPYLTLAALLAPLPLHRLCVSEFAPPSRHTDLPPWASSLTQLGLTKVLPRDPTTAFAVLPALTHLAVDYDAFPNPNPDDHDPRSRISLGAGLSALLGACPRLRWLVLMTTSKTDYKWAYQRLREDGFADARFAVHLRPIQDGTWDAWSRRVPDMFVEAEVAMERRRS
ncbi:hypothetical protein B0H12DRAFT_1284142 [Mycena haematopus]|nr:hypothetical protein B0H12DRAFT_1284142 [Mycena haematopus]